MRPADGVGKNNFRIGASGKKGSGGQGFVERWEAPRTLDEKNRGGVIPHGKDPKGRGNRRGE